MPDHVRDPTGQEAPRRARWLRWLPLILLVGASLAALVSGVTHLLDTERLMTSRAWLHATVAENRPRAIGLAILLFVTSVVVSVPVSVILTMIYGFLFGTVTAALIALCSATTGASIVFTVGRHAARDLITRRVGSRLGRLASGFRRDAFSYVVFLRLLPLFPFWMTNLAPAALGVRPRTFILATLVGLTPGAFVYAATGAGFEDLVAAHQTARAACLAQGGSACDAALDLRKLITPGMVASLGALAGFALLSIGLRRWFEHRAARA